MHRTLIVANRTSATPVLLQEVERRAGERPTSFVALIPRESDRDWSEREALRLLRRAARGPTGFLDPDVEGYEAGEDALVAVRRQLKSRHFDDAIVSTRPPSRWRRSLPARIEALGLPVQVIAPPAQPRSLIGLLTSDEKRPVMGGGY
jgi:hypothetical protein